MKKPFDFIILLSPCLLWLFAAAMLGDEFSMPNRLILAILCTAIGAGALLTQRKIAGILTLAGGLAMLASVPITHEVPEATYALSMQSIQVPESKTTDTKWELKLNDSQADLVTLTNKATPQAEVNPVESHPFAYQSCSSAGPQIFARYPMHNVLEAKRVGASQIKGQLEIKNKRIAFAVLDLSATQTHAERLAVLAEFLPTNNQPGIAVIDTGEAGATFPMDYLAHAAGYIESKPSGRVFGENFGLWAEAKPVVFLHSKAFICNALANERHQEASCTVRYQYEI